MKGYRPPAYPLLEARFHRSDNNTARWLYSWNGPATEAARDVTLAASSPVGRALVTSGLWANEPDAQLSALLAANSLKRPRLFGKTDMDAAIEDTAWLRALLTINGESTQVTMGEIDDLTVAYGINIQAQFTAAWKTKSELDSLCTIDAAEYLIDPLAIHPYPSLNEQTSKINSIVEFYSD